MSGVTPGRWSFDGQVSVIAPPITGCTNSGRADGCQLVALVYSHDGDLQANADLIAAAKPMLRSLMRMVMWSQLHAEPVLSGRGEVYENFARDLSDARALIDSLLPVPSPT
jgi:hypothetical protein